MEWNKKLDEIFKTIKEENKDYDERIANGDIYIPNCLIIGRPFKINEVFYICCYYAKNRNVYETDKEMLKMGLSKNQLYLVKKKLKSINIIKSKKLNIVDLKKETIKLSHKGYKCEWCGKGCYILHEHHYPIPKKDGGTEIVRICPNCHYTFHKLESENCL